jgi:predicted DsbA family dithiol-disulfide isomerase
MLGRSSLWNASSPGETATVSEDSDPVVEVFADVCCPFTHVGLRRLVERRDELGRADVRMRVRAWPLEVVNGAPLDPALVAEEVHELRSTVAPDLFAGFDVEAFPSTSRPALALAFAGYRRDISTGEAVSLALRELLFEKGEDIGDPSVLALVEQEFGIHAGADDAASVDVDHREGSRRGVIGSPHFFTSSGSFFCPALDIGRDESGRLRISLDAAGFGEFLDSCFADAA